MFDGLSGRGSSPGADPRDCPAARLNAQHQAVRDIADWLQKVPDCSHGSFRTVTLMFSFPPCTETNAVGGRSMFHASCRWTGTVTSASQAVTSPAGKTSAFAPSSRFTLLSDQFYEAAGSARGEDTIGHTRACADAQKNANHQAMESIAKAGLCDQEGAAMRIIISFGPPTPALLGGGRYGIGGFEAVCDWNLIIEAVSPNPADSESAALGSKVISGSDS